MTVVPARCSPSRSSPWSGARRLGRRPFRPRPSARSPPGATARPGSSPPRARRPGSPARHGRSTSTTSPSRSSRSPRSRAAARDRHAGDGSGRLFVAEQDGPIRIVRDGDASCRSRSSTSATEITSGGERGLLGLAFHPDFPTDPRVFVDYTDTNGDTRVASLHRRPDEPGPGRPGVRAAAALRRPALREPQRRRARVRPGRLPLHRARRRRQRRRPARQRPERSTTLLGKILRIDVDGSRAATRLRRSRPTTRSSASAAAAGEIWLYGPAQPVAVVVRPGDRRPLDRRRRPERLGGDRRRAGRASGGTNFGWNRMEGDATASGRRAAATRRAHAARRRVRPRPRLHGHRRLRLPRLGAAGARRRLPVRATTAPADLGDRPDERSAPRADRRRPTIERDRSARSARTRRASSTSPTSRRPLLRVIGHALG